METTKLTAKFYAPMWRDFNDQVDHLFLKRDMWLDSIISQEVRYLARDMDGKRLSNKAALYIARELQALGTKTVSIQVKKSTADALNKVVADTGIVRDAFLNRLIMFLRSSDSLMDYLELPKLITAKDFRGTEPMPTSPLLAWQTIQSAPFFYIRTAIQEMGFGLYNRDLPPKLHAFECYLSDKYVPGTDEYKQEQQVAADVLAVLFETDFDIDSTN